MYNFKKIDGKIHLVLTEKEWNKMSKDYKTIMDGKKFGLCMYEGRTTLAPIIIEG